MHTLFDIIDTRLISEAQASMLAQHMPHVLLGTKLLEAASPHIMQLGKKILLVADENTYAAFGAAVNDSLRSLECVIFSAGVLPTLENAQHIAQKAALYDIIIAVGSGVINDICKYAAALAHRPYVIFATAPSMNGYVSSNASILVDGYKKTLKATLPCAAYFDMEILASAPARLILSGLGDSLCRPTAQADWLLSHLLFSTPYTTLPFDLTAPYENALISHAAALTEGDLDAIALLTKTLIASGIGMLLSGGSYPASQGEHMIAHTYEMLTHPTPPASLHGQEVGVTTLYMARLQTAMLADSSLMLRAKHPADALFITVFGKHHAAEAKAAWSEKALHKDMIAELNARCMSGWNEIRERINAVHIAPHILEACLKKAKAPTTSDELGWSRAVYRTSCENAVFTRNRFTFLDLAYYAN